MAYTASEMGKKSWEVRKSPQELQRLKEISRKGVEARKNRQKTDTESSS